MKIRRKLSVITIMAAAQLGITMPAKATPILGLIAFPASMTIATLNKQLECDRQIKPALGKVKALATHADVSSLLGGHASKLDLIRHQQAGETLDIQDTVHTDSFDQDAGNCQDFIMARPVPEPAIQDLGPSTSGPDDFLASRRLPIGRTQFDSSWDRVSRATLPRSATSAFSNFAHGRLSRSTLAAVNTWTNSRIHYVEDKDLYGRADYWATASMTLKRRAGDCEDIAIAKMQLLAAMGLPRSNMYLTIVRDLVRNADHAVLIVKFEGNYLLLDNSTDRLLDAKLGNDYRPILSFGNGQKWLHGSSAIASRPSINQPATGHTFETRLSSPL